MAMRAMRKNTKTERKPKRENIKAADTGDNEALSETERKPKREYIKAADAVGSAVYLEDGDVWLKSSSNPDWAPGVTINTGDNEALSDWLRHITLHDVVVFVGKRRGSDGKDYPELIIQGGNQEGDLPF